MKKILYISILLYICLNSSVAAKLGVSSVSTVSGLLMLLLFIHRFFSLKLDFITNNFKEEIIFFGIAVVTIFIKFLYGDFIAIKESLLFLFLPAAFSILLGTQNYLTRKNICRLVLYFFIAECGLAIIERTLHINVFPAFSEELMKEDYMVFRSTAFMGHPLTNALVVSILMGFISISSLKHKYKSVFIIIGFVALLCFNARGASLAWMLIGGIYFINYLVSSKLSAIQVSFILVGFIAVVSALATLILQYGFGDRLVNSDIMDGSAMARFKVFSAFNFISTPDLWLGNSLNYTTVMRKLGAGGVENSYIVMILDYGIVITACFLATYFILIKRLLKGLKTVEKVIIILSFIMVGSMNNALASSTPWAIFLLCAHTFIPIKKVRLKQKQMLRARLIESYRERKITFKLKQV